METGARNGVAIRTEKGRKRERKTEAKTDGKRE